MSSRGIRNNNPGNIRHSKANNWQGAAKEQPDKSFVSFTSEVYGIRAIARLLISYQDNLTLWTIRQLITRWAPPTENVTKRYIDFVAEHAGMKADQKLDMHKYEHLRKVVEGIIDYENTGTGVPYPDAVMVKALALAGVEPEKPRALAATRTGKGGAVAIVGSGVTAILEPAQTIFQQLAPYLKIAQYGLLAITLVGVVWMLWARVDDMRRLNRP